MKRFATPTLLGLAILGASASHADPFRPGIKDQIDLGKRAATQVRKEQKVLPDSDPRVKELRRIGKKLVSLIPAQEKKDKPFEYTFDVIDNKEVNAFALPGGPIFFYTGLMDQLTTEDALVAIVGHELTHVRNQHWASAYADNTKRQLGITVILTLLGAGKTAFDVASVSDALLFSLPYSRRHETESDDVGYEMMIQAGYNPKGMADMFKLLMKAGGSRKNEEWMSTHPDSANRLKRVEDKIAKDKRKFPKMRSRSTRVRVSWENGWPTLD